MLNLKTAFVLIAAGGYALWENLDRVAYMLR